MKNEARKKRVVVIERSNYLIGEYTLSTCTNFSCFQLFIPEERKKKGFSRVLIFANQSYQKYFAGTNFREFGSKTRNSRKLVPAKISTPKVFALA